MLVRVQAHESFINFFQQNPLSTYFMYDFSSCLRRYRNESDTKSVLKKTELSKEMMFIEMMVENKNWRCAKRKKG